MEFFELLRKHFVMCGIEISKKSTKNHPFNEKNLKIFMLVCLHVILFAVMLIESDSFGDSTYMVFQTFSTGSCGICYIIIVWTTSNLFEFINNVADTVNESE